MTAFAAYARYYDLLYRDKDYAGETEFIVQAINSFSGGAEDFLEFGSGTVVNEKKQTLLGPFLKNGFMDLLRSKVFLLDGTNLGVTKALLI